MFVFNVFAVEEDKPVMLFIHGQSIGLSSFEKALANPQLQKFADLDANLRPGYDRGDKSKKVYSFAEQIEFFSQKINSIDKSRSIIIVGYSYGSVIAMSLAAKFQRRIERLILVSGVYNPDSVMKGDFLRIAQWLLPNLQQLSELVALPKDLQKTMDELKNIKTQVIAVHGKEDGRSPAKDLEYIRALRPIAYIREGKGHKLFSEDDFFLESLLTEVAREEYNKRFDQPARKP